MQRMMVFIDYFVLMNGIVCTDDRRPRCYAFKLKKENNVIRYRCL